MLLRAKVVRYGGITKSMGESRYVVGIDLGTSNCAVAFVEPGRGASAPVTDFPVAQLRRAGDVAALSLLPSALYLPGEHELPPGATKLPWGEETQVLVGEFARWQGARVPGRLITSAKSWLCHGGVDRTAGILPWGAPAEIRKVSPVEASARLLAHITNAWNSAHPHARLHEQEVVITVPASFDEAARALTASAVVKSGLERFTLLEEPQAAFYDFIARHRGKLEKVLEGVRLLLVVDVGGGTSDFTLVQVALDEHGVLLRRIAVGDHLMLGGDNMDAALARVAEARMLSGDRRLSPAQWSQLLQAARVGKEQLLSHAAPSAKVPDRFNLSVVSEGSRLMGSSLSTYISRAEAGQLILEGFFPLSEPGETPRAGGRTALQEVGLPYAQDPAITRQLAGFLRVHAEAGFAALGEAVESRNLPRPDALLLNGGVFNSERIATRFVEAISRWWPDSPQVPLLLHDSLDLAVARGAAYYGLVRHGLGHRITGGAAHALYLGLEKTGTQEPMALCVVPRGQEEGQTLDLGGRTFLLAVQKPVRFPLFSTAADRVDKSGDVVPVSDDLQPLPAIHTLLRSSHAPDSVPVHLSATLTEIGTLELWCVSNTTPERWRLEFELRTGSSASPFAVTAPMPPSFAEARLWIERIYGSKLRAPSVKGHAAQRIGVAHKADPKGTPPRDAKQLWASLERTLGSREQWTVPILRELWTALFGAADKRRRSAEHERIFFQLLGYCLRPGFGYPLDEWRCEESARFFSQGVQFHQEQAVWKEFWIMWRRLSGGLSEQRHQELWSYLKPFLASKIPPGAKAPPKQKAAQPQGLDEMVRLAASLEHLEPAEKATLGDWIIPRLRHPETASGPWTWALGRLGTRTPIFGSVHKTLPSEKVAQWVERLLDESVLRLEGSLFALTQMGRLTGDRLRDLEFSWRQRILEALREAEASPSWQRMLTEVVALEAADKARAIGDTLPAGLTLA